MASINEHASKNIAKILIGNKKDIPDRCLKASDGEAVANKYGMNFSKPVRKLMKIYLSVFMQLPNKSSNL